MAWLGRFAAPLLALLVYWAIPGESSGPDLPIATVGASAAPFGPGPLASSATLAISQAETPGLSHRGRATAAIAVFMAVLWLTEALPLPVTSLLPIVLFPLCGVFSIREAAAPYAREYIFLFLGGFLLALAMEKWNLHRRIALLTILIVGTRPARLVGGIMLASGLLSMWISNTATAVLMLPIGISLVQLVSDSGPWATADSSPERQRPFQNFSTALMLGIAYGASIGGMGTIVGSPPNLFLASYVEDNLGVAIGFGRWMLIGVPLALVFLTTCWLFLTRVAFPIRLAELPGGRSLILSQLAELGRLSRGERVVTIVFVLTAAAWILREPLTRWTWLVETIPPVARLHDAGIALIAAIALFAIPVDWKAGVFALDWDVSTKVPWGVLLLFGGGLSLASAFQHSGLSVWIGEQVRPLGFLPPLVFIVLTTSAVLLLTELTSNTATATTFFPILAGVALGVGIEPLLLLLPAALAASCAFMMPVATPPNAIVFGSGRITLLQMVYAGLWLNLTGLVLIIATAMLAHSLGII